MSTDPVKSLTDCLSEALYYGIVGDYEYLMRTLADVIILGGVPRSYDDIVRVADLGYQRDALIGTGGEPGDPEVDANSNAISEACAVLAEQLVAAIPAYQAKVAAS